VAFETQMNPPLNRKVGRVTPCAPGLGQRGGGAHLPRRCASTARGMTRPATWLLEIREAHSLRRGLKAVRAACQKLKGRTQSQRHFISGHLWSSLVTSGHLWASSRPENRSARPFFGPILDRFLPASLRRSFIAGGCPPPAPCGLRQHVAAFLAATCRGDQSTDLSARSKMGWRFGLAWTALSPFPAHAEKRVSKPPKRAKRRQKATWKDLTMKKRSISVKKR
jgi:hypothetical protein